jgi:hypothetical protein
MTGWLLGFCCCSCCWGGGKAGKGGLKKLPLLANVACACCVFWVTDGSDCTSHVSLPVPCNGAVVPRVSARGVGSPPLDLPSNMRNPASRNTKIRRRWAGVLARCPGCSLGRLDDGGIRGFFEPGARRESARIDGLRAHPDCGIPRRNAHDSVWLCREDSEPHVTRPSSCSAPPAGGYLCGVAPSRLGIRVVPRTLRHQDCALPWRPPPAFAYCRQTSSRCRTPPRV